MRRRLCTGDAKDQTHLYMRPKDVEMDVELLDKHDSFYHTTKSLLVLFQIMGVMPIMRSPKGELHSENSRTIIQLNFVLLIS